MLPLLAVLIHLFALSALPLAEGRAHGGEVQSWPHIEVEGEGGCPSPHGDLDCRICSVFGRNLVGPPRVLVVLDTAPTTYQAADGAPLWHRSATIASRVGARAPPYL